jgi:hypothetical protein
MSHTHESGAAPDGPAPASPSPADIDKQVVATWRALHTNPDLDDRCAMQAIDQLLDLRSQPTENVPAYRNPPAVSGTLVPGSSAQHAVLATVLHALLAGDAG